MERLGIIARRNGGYVTRADLASIPFSASEMTRLVGAEAWRRLRPGVFAPAETYDRLSSRAQHLVKLRSALDALGNGYAATHDSAAIVHGLDDYELDLDVVHVAKVGGTTSRRRNGIARHRESLDPAFVVEVEGIPVVTAERAVAQVATTVSVEVGAVLVSSWLREQRADARRQGMVELFSQEEAKAEIEAVLASFGSRAGLPDARDAVAVADARCDSVGEVRVLVLCWRFDIERPHPQYEIPLAGGARFEVDFMWPDARHVVEFDGALKYEDDPDGMSARQKIMAEKGREGTIRDLGYGVTRVTWIDLAPQNQSRTAARINRDLARSRRLYAGG